MFVSLRPVARHGGEDREKQGHRGVGGKKGERRREARGGRER